MDIITNQDVVFGLDVTSKKEALEALAQMAFERGKVSEAKVFFAELCKREEEGTTGFGNGIAIPHARHACVKEAGILFIRSAHDLDWNSIDGNPVEACICLIAPDDKNDFHLKMLSKLARKLMHEDFVEILKSANQETVLKTINEVLN